MGKSPSRQVEAPGVGCVNLWFRLADLTRVATRGKALHSRCNRLSPFHFHSSTRHTQQSTCSTRSRTLLRPSKLLLRCWGGDRLFVVIRDEDFPDAVVTVVSEIPLVPSEAPTEPACLIAIVKVSRSSEESSTTSADDLKLSGCLSFLRLLIVSPVDYHLVGLQPKPCPHSGCG